MQSGVWNTACAVKAWGLIRHAPFPTAVEERLPRLHSAARATWFSKMTRNKALALTQHVQSIVAGTPVIALERLPESPPVSAIDIDDCAEVYLDDNVVQMFPEIDTPCEASPSGQCTYDALAGDEHDCCIYCGRRTG